MSVKPTLDEEPGPRSAETEARLLVARASPGRTAVRVLGALVAVGALGLGAWKGQRWLAQRKVAGAEMRKFPASHATIGNPLWPEERPVHEVDLSAFWLDRTEVTVADYEACVGAGECSAPQKGGYCNTSEQGRADHPINCVSFEQAARFCAWAGKRLPTEKEWEHAARAANDDPMAKQRDLFPWGPGAPSAARVNGCGKECGEHFAQRGKKVPQLHELDDGYPLTAPVKSFSEGDTPDGLRHMAGNVWEWTQSPFCAYPDERCGNELERVIRGGGFLSHQERTFEATSREALARSEASETVGFRCARDAR